MKHECDENCRSCPQCYVKYGETLCEQLCKCSVAYYQKLARHAFGYGMTQEQFKRLVQNDR